MAKLLPLKGPLPPPDPPIEPPPIPPPVDGVVLGAPTGSIPMDLKIAFGRGGPWSKVNQDDPLFIKYGKKHTVKPQMLKAMQVVESGGDMIWNQGGSGAFGTMQIKDAFWGAEAQRLGYNLKTREGQVGMAAAMLGGDARGVIGSTPEERFLQSYYPVRNPDGSICLNCKGEDGHTPQQYLDDMRRLMKIIDKAADGVITPPPPPPPETRHPYEVMFGFIPEYPFGFRKKGGVGYPYGVNHGTLESAEHTGDDINVPFGTQFRSPGNGKVLCVGEKGSGMWGQACGFFRDTGHGGPTAPSVGVGNITVLFDSGHKVVFGHCRTCNFKVGDRVKTGDVIGTTGGMLGPHMHMEVAVSAPEKVPPADRRDGITYWLVNPVPALRIVMGQDGAQPPPVVVTPITDIIWEGTTNFHDRRGQVPVALVIHMTDDRNFSNVKNHFQNPGSNASAQFVITPDGGKHQFVGSNKSSWTNGIINRPRTDILWLNEAIQRSQSGLANLNDYTLNLEILAARGDRITNEAMESLVEIGRYYRGIYPTILPNRGHVLRHGDIDSVDRPYCPGDVLDLNEYIQEIGGNPVVMNP